MILSVSRRPDIPAFYADWFCNRIKEGFLYVRNPMNAHQISRIDLLPEVVDCIVFWTKNPVPMLELAERMVRVAGERDLVVESCAERVDLNRQVRWHRPVILVLQLIAWRCFFTCLIKGNAYPPAVLADIHSFLIVPAAQTFFPSPCHFHG